MVEINNTNLHNLAVKEYGDDPFKFGGQRDGFKQGFKTAEAMFNKSHSEVINEVLKKLKTKKELKNQLVKNLELYKKLKLKTEYEKTFSNWNTNNLIIFDLEDILSRMGYDVDDHSV